MKGKHEKEKQKSLGMMDIVLIIVGIALVVFTAIMIWLFCAYGTIPDTLCSCVYATLGGECGILGWIKTTKERNKERKWELQDRKEAQQQQGISIAYFKNPDEKGGNE